jgi:hypothetical protein
MISADPVLSPPAVGRQLAYRLVIPAAMLCAYGALAMLWHWGPRSVYFDVLRFVGIEPFCFPFSIFMRCSPPWKAARSPSRKLAAATSLPRKTFAPGTRL